MKNCSTLSPISIIIIGLLLSYCSNTPSKEIIEENFQDYELDADISQLSESWENLSDSAGASITNMPETSNRLLKIERKPKRNPNVLMKLHDWKNGRYRLSWDIRVEEGRGAYFRFQDDKNLNSSVYNVYFEDGNGYITLGKSKNSSPFRFYFLADQASNFVQIIDLSKNTAEFWIDGYFIGEADDLNFSRNITKGERYINFVGATNKYKAVGNNSLYYLDNIKVFPIPQNPKITREDNPVCVKGQEFKNPSYAQAKGYTDKEWREGPCIVPQNTVCHLGGILIDNGLPYSNEISSTDYPVEILEAFSFSGFSSAELIKKNYYFDLYIYKHDKKDFDIEFLESNKTPEIFAFRCDCADEAPKEPQDHLCKANVVSRSLDGSMSFGGQPHGIYYIMVAGEQNTRYAFLTGPPGYCKVEPTMINCGESIQGSLTAGNTSNFQNCSRLIEIGKENVESCLDNPFSSCYNGNRTYEGPDTLYQIDIAGHQIIDIQLESESDLGMFLYDNQCGERCISYIETSDNQTTVTAKDLALQPGIYYLLIDKATVEGSASYTVSITCEANTSIQYFQKNTLPCPVAKNKSPHDIVIVGLNNTTLAGQSINASLDQFTYEMALFYFDHTGFELTLFEFPFWNQQPFQEKIYEDNLLIDTTKCSYIEGDSLMMKIVRTDAVHPAPPNTFLVELDKVYGTKHKKFHKTANSIIVDLIDRGIISLDVQPAGPIPVPLSGAANEIFDVLTGGFWKVQVSPTDNWIHITSTPTGIGPGHFEVDFDSALVDRTGRIIVTGPGNLIKEIVVYQTTIP